MNARWIFTTPGQPAFYRDGDSICERDGGNVAYLVNGKWWYEVQGGAAAYYESDDTIFTTNGVPAFYYGK